MGNVDQSQQSSNPHPEQQSKNKKVINHKYVLQIRERQIILDYKNKIKLMIGDVLSFPSGGFQGLHLWDANVILARYILINKQQFAGKSVIQLLSGTGIASIAMKKFTNASKIAATDQSLEVTSNLTKNCQKNDIASGMIVACISWLEYVNYKAKFDFVIGADLLYKGCPVDVLQNALEKLLNVGGKALLISPQRSNNQDCATQFVSKLDYKIFSFKKQKLHDQMYMESPLLNQVVGYEEFKLISEGLFYLYTLQKIKQKQEDKAEKDRVQEKETDKNKKEPTPNKIPEPAQQKQSRKIQQKNTHQFEIKEGRFQILSQEDKTQHLKKQLQVVTITKKQDVPEYQRKKKKDLNDILDSQDAKQKKESEKHSKDQEDEAQQIQVVHKQHNLYDQPEKKAEPDRKSMHSQKQSGFRKSNADELEDIRMRKKSNPQ